MTDDARDRGWRLVPASIRGRLTLWYALGLAVFMVGFGVVSYGLLARATARRIDDSLQETARAFATAWAAQGAESPRRVAAPIAAVRRFGAGDLEIVVFDRARRVVAASPSGDAWVEERDDLEPRPHLATMLGRVAEAQGTFATVRDGKGPRRVFAMPLDLGGRRQTVTVALGVSDRDAMLGAVRRVYYIAIPVAMLLALGGGYLLAASALSPVRTMATQAERIGAATLHERLRVRNDRDELGQLARVFNGLLDRLDRAFDQQRQFVADASHELRTPVSVVRGEAEVALARGQRPEAEYRETLEIIHDESRRMSRLVDDLFLLARADAGQHAVTMTELYLDEIVAESVRSLRTLAAARGVTLRADAEEDLPFCGDESLLRRLMANLVENAIKYGRAASPVTVRAWREGERYLLSVHNEGPPIAPEVASRMFDRFFRAGEGAPAAPASDGAGGGAGLGLAIGRWIAEAHGGSLELARSDETGTEFRVVLPAPRSGA